MNESATPYVRVDMVVSTMISIRIKHLHTAAIRILKGQLYTRSIHKQDIGYEPIPTSE